MLKKDFFKENADVITKYWINVSWKNIGFNFLYRNVSSTFFQ
jgi:hypothetical protein